jgi:hypothetical protein
MFYLFSSYSFFIDYIYTIITAMIYINGTLIYQESTFIHDIEKLDPHINDYIGHWNHILTSNKGKFPNISYIVHFTQNTAIIWYIL